MQDSLRELACLLGELYEVGGAVRDRLLGISSHDLDICSPLTADEVRAKLIGSRFSVIPVSERLGTVLIYGGGLKAEYTAFRTDSYPNDGSHRPSSVEFTRDIKKDALRRDFTVNALYYDLINERIVDPLDGLEDLGKKQLRTVDRAEKVFGEDGLRIMRLARLAAELNFSIEPNTFEGARLLAHNLADISKERIAEELLRILNADERHPELHLKGAAARGIDLLTKTGAMLYVVPELLDEVGCEQSPEHHIYDVYNHTLAALSVASANIRLAVLFHDIGKPPTKLRDGNTYAHAEVGAEITAKRLHELKLPKRLVSRTVRLVQDHMLDMTENMRENKLRLYIAQNADIVEDLIELKKADIFGATGKSFSGKLHIEQVYEAMREDGSPFSVADLAIGGKELVEEHIPPEVRGEFLQKLLHEAILNPSLRTKEKQLELLRNWRNKL